MSTCEFYQTRAAEERLAAAASPLANVRDRCLRAAAAWDVMALRAARLRRHRAEEEARRAMRDDPAAPGVSAAPVAPVAARGH